MRVLREILGQDYFFRALGWSPSLGDGHPFACEQRTECNSDNPRFLFSLLERGDESLLEAPRLDLDVPVHDSFDGGEEIGPQSRARRTNFFGQRLAQDRFSREVASESGRGHDDHAPAPVVAVGKQRDSPWPLGALSCMPFGGQLLIIAPEHWPATDGEERR